MVQGAEEPHSVMRKSKRRKREGLYLKQGTAQAMSEEQVREEKDPRSLMRWAARRRNIVASDLCMVRNPPS